MNRIFKVIWSEARNAYVVVSELTKRQSKSCSTKKLLATLIAAGVFSMAGMHAPVSAAEVGLVANTQYAAIAVKDINNNYNTKPGDDYKKVNLKVYDQNGNPTGEQREYYVRKGFTVYLQKQEQVLTGSNVQEIVIALVSGEPEKGSVMSSTQNIIEPLANSNNENVTTVLGQSLNGTSLNTYTAAVNGGIDASSTWDYIIQDVNGTWVNVKDSTNASKLVELTRGTDGNYYYGSQKINIENVYFLKKGNVATPMSFVDSNGSIYTGTVRGLHNEYLMTGQDAEGNIYTYWGAKADDDNTLLANSGITVGQLNKSFDTLEANEQRLADADIKSIKLNETNKTINLIRNDIAETLVAGGLTLGSGGGVDGKDTYVTIANTDGTIKLPSGSKVVATASEDKKLTGLSINGIDYQLSGVDTDTTYTISSENGTGNVVKKYKITGSDSSIMEFVDTDTRVTSGSISYSGQEKGEDGVPTSGIKGTLTLGVNDGSSITITGLNDTTLKSGGFDIDVSGEEGESETSRKMFYIEDTAGNRIEIENVANIEDVNVVRDKVEQGFNVSAGSKTHNIKLGETLNFVNGTNTEVSLDDSGSIKIDATDTNTYTTSASYDDSTKKATFTRTDGVTYELNLSGLGSMSSWTAKVGETTQSISNNDVLEFAGANSASISMENGVITISAIDTNTKYQITEKTNGESTPANVVKTYNFSEIGSSEAGVDLVDTDTTYKVEDVTSSTSGAVSAKKLVNNLGEEIGTFVDTDTQYTAGTGITIDSSKNNQISINANEVANSVSINYKANGGSAKSVSLSDGLNFVQGDNVQISTGENGVVNISATDTNTFTTEASYNSSTKKATFSGTNGLSYDLDLSEITSGLGSMSSWTAKVGETTQSISNNNVLEFAGANSASISMENGVITISAIDTNTKYQITKKEKDSSTPANVVKAYNFNEIGSSGEGVDLIDTDTTYRVEDVTTSTPGAISAKKLVNNLGQEIDTFVDTDTKYTAGTGITIDLSNNNQISIIPSEVANNVSISYKANSGNAKSVSLSDGLNFVQGGSVQITTDENGVVNISGTDTRNTTIAGKNIDVTYDANNLQYTVKTVDDVVFTSVTANTATIGGIGISNTGITMNGQKITDLAAGVADTDAVNLGQLKEYAATAGANTKVLAGKNISVESNTAGGKNEYTVNLDNNVTLGSDTEDGSLVVKSSVGDVLISNGQIIGDKYAITNDGGAVFANGVISAAGDGTFRAANGSFTVFADGTIDSKMGADGRLLATSDGLSVAKGSSSFVVTGAGISLSAGESALVVGGDGGTAIKGGLNVLGSKITNVAAGEADTDAVNVSQLNAVAASSKTEVVGEKNISVNEETAADGHSIYKVGLDNNVTLGSDTEDGSLVVKSSVGDVLISNGQIIGDKYAITNDGGAIFANGVISAAGDGTFRAANGSFTVFADGTIDSKMGEDGRLLATSQGLSVAKGSNAFVVTGDGISLSAGESALVVGAGGTAIKGGLNVLGSKITNVAAGVADTDAVNVGQLREAIAAGDTHIKSGVYQVGEVSLDEEGNKSQGVSIDVVDGSGNVTGNVKITDVAKASDLGDVSKLDADLKNSESNVTTVVDAVNNLNDKVGDLQYLNVAEGDIQNGDDTTTAIGKLNQALKDVSQKATAHNTVSGDTNITISESTNSDGGTNYALALNKEKIDLGNVTIEGEKGSITAGKANISDAGVKFDGKTYIDDKGLNANDQKITNVAAGEVSETSKDAVNGSQLYATNQQINQNIANINNLDNKISRLGSRVNKVGAGAAALAALHPLDFDPDDKLSFAVGMGNYAGQNAAAIGAFYRPNEKVMMSVGGTYGNDENMVNVGLSFALDRTNNVSNSRTAMAKEIIELRSHVAKQDQQIAQLTALVNKLVGNDAVKGEGVLFPDVPENHWAYEYINGLVQAGVIDGYPDGTFGGERSLTRYEYASMLYKAMLKGTILNRDIVKEFESEIARIRVDRISGNDNDANKIERVRVNYQNRDNYGTRIAK